jgi:hypothetical protein
MTSPEFVTDIDGAKVRLGDTVRVLAIDPSIKLEKDEVEKVNSMIGEEFEVDEIDEHGCAWVTKWWRTTENESEAHGISLTSQQMKLVRSKNGS